MVIGGRGNLGPSLCQLLLHWPDYRAPLCTESTRQKIYNKPQETTYVMEILKIMCICKTFDKKILTSALQWSIFIFILDAFSYTMTFKQISQEFAYIVRNTLLSCPNQIEYFF